MGEISVPTVYFERPGKENTERTLEIALHRAVELGIERILVATTFGDTGLAAARLFQDYHLVVVTHCAGFTSPGVQELTPQNRRALEDAGATILTCTHAFGSTGRAVRKKLNTYQVDEIMAFTLRTAGEGFKVAIEITLMAADAGLLPMDQEVIAIGGTGRGADTALVLKPAHAHDFFDLRVVEVLCKPRLGLR